MISRILPIILLLLAAGIFFGYASPLYNSSIVPLQAQIKTQDATLAAAKSFKSEESALTAQRNQIPADQLARLQTYLPDGVDNVQLILDLNSLATRSGMKLSNFNVAPSAQTSDPSAGTSTLMDGAKPIDTVDITVDGIGTYSGFRTFLAGLERSLRPMDLIGLTVKSSGTNVYTYEMTLRIYSLH